MYILRKIEPNQDCNQLFELINKQHYMGGLFARQLWIMNAEEYRRWITERLGGYFHDFYVVEERTNMDIVNIQGFMVSYDYREYDSHCHIYSYMCYGKYSVVLGQFVDILFKEYPIKKMFLETAEINDELINAAYDLGFTKEAMLEEYRFINGQNHASLVLSLYQKDRRRIQ